MGDNEEKVITFLIFLSLSAVSKHFRVVIHLMFSMKLLV